MGMDGGCILLDISKISNKDFKTIKYRIEGLQEEEWYLEITEDEEVLYKKISRAKNKDELKGFLLEIRKYVPYVYNGIFNNTDYFLLGYGDTCSDHQNDVAGMFLGIEAGTYYETWT